jgi:Cu(I)-responsive transcriptional regulator
MNIGMASRGSNVSAKMIRHYEALGLLPKMPRNAAGYRQYDEASVHTLRFIRRARDLGFSIREITALLGLWRNRRRASADVKRIALAHAGDLQRRIDEMQAMQRTLKHLAHRCHGDSRPDCPILDDLAKDGNASARSLPPTARRDAESSSVRAARGRRCGAAVGCGKMRPREAVTKGR